MAPEMGTKKTGPPKSRDISATRLSSGDPIGFPPHPREWFSIIVYHHLVYTAVRWKNRAAYTLVWADPWSGSFWITSLAGFSTQKSRGFVSSCDISATRLSLWDP